MQYLEKTGPLLALIMMLVMAMPSARAAAASGPDLAIGIEEYAALRERPGVLLLDAESPELYQRGHIPGAVNLPLSLFADLESRKKLGYPVNEKDAGKLLGEAGIDKDTLVVVYDQGDGKAAAGMWFVLDFFGHEKIRILDGGFRQWVRAGRPATQEVPGIEKKTYVARADPDMVVTLQWLKKNLRGKNVVILDGRSLNEYIGQDILGGSSRGGHIPGARHLEWTRLASDQGVIRPAAEIREILEQQGISRDSQLITYCNIGVGRSSFLYLALEQAGYPNVKVFTGSWEEWSGDPRLPIQR